MFFFVKLVFVSIFSGDVTKQNFNLRLSPTPPSPFDACYAGYWTSDKDYTFVKEARFLEPYQYKSGSKLAGQKLKEVADNLNCLQAFKDSPRDQRSVTERLRLNTKSRWPKPQFKTCCWSLSCSKQKSERKKPPVGFLQNLSLKQSNLPRRSWK